jgi:hypothetical protein
MIATLVSAALLALAPDAGAADAAPPDAPPADAGASDAGAGSADTVTPTPLPPPPRGRLDLRVFGLGSRKPVPGASLTVDVEEMGETDRQGRVSADVPCGPRHVALQVPGFEPLALVHDACASREPVTVRLAPRSGAAAYETVVRAPTSRQSVRLEGDEVTHTPGTLGDPFRAVESLPGVTAVAWPAPIYAVRGANPGNTGFLLDDLRVPALFHFLLGPSVIHPYFFEGLDFYPGGYPARYGRYVAGLVSARTRVAPDDDIHSSVDVRLFDAGAIVTAPLPRGGSVSASGRYSYTSTVIGLLSNDVSVSYWDYQLRADRPVGPFRLTLLAFGSSDAMTTGTDSQTLALAFHRVKLRADLPAGDGRLTGSVGVGLDHSEAPLSSLNTFRLAMDAKTVLPRLSYTHPWQHADLEIGLDGEVTHYQPLDTLAMLDRPGPLDLGRERTARLLAVYASAVVRAGARLLLTPEVRVDGYDIGAGRRADVGPRLSARLALDDRTYLRAMGGRFSQPPSLPIQIPGLDNFGLALFGLQTSWQGSLTAGTARLPGLELELTGFVQRYVLTDIRDPVPSRSNDPFADDFLVRRDALSTGLELMIRRPATERLHGWLAYTLSNNQRALGGGVIGPSDWDQRHVLNFVAGYRFGKTTVGGRFHYNTGRPVLVEGNSAEQFVRLPSFYQVDLRVDRRVLFQKFRMDLYLELVNATLNRQVLGLSPSFDGRIRTDSFKFVLPSMGIHAEI